MIEKEMPKLCINPQSRLSSCLYPNSARTPASASSTVPEPLLTLEALFSIRWPGSAIAAAAISLASAIVSARLMDPSARYCD